MFCTRGSGDRDVRYSVVVCGGSVTFIRVGSQRKPFCVIVPRAFDEWLANVGVEELARIAIAQSLRDGWFHGHPEEAVDLDVGNVHRWDAELARGQWLHGSPTDSTRRSSERFHEDESKLEERVYASNE